MSCTLARTLVYTLSALSVTVMLGCDHESTPTRETTSPEVGSAGMSAGRSANGSAGEAVAGEAVAGEAVAGEAVAGEAVAGEAVAGEAVAGEAVAGEAVAGEAVAGEAGASPAGENTTGGEPSRPASCLISCAEFVECAIKQCPGYDEADDALLMEECLSLCTPTIAGLFDRIAGCGEKIRFASTVRTDFLDFCDSASEGFCETYVATCGEWLGEGPCEDHYNLAPARGPEPNLGANQLCYEYHLGSAMVALDADDAAGVRVGCERAAGLAMCVDE